ncbi:MAG: sialidase family protein, partial [Armatimonadota bacterium]|nr:sialidase family protein [Armatimonadota bacterium]
MLLWLFLAMVCGAAEAPAGAAEKPGRTKVRSLTHAAERHVTIARSEGDYISFPDVCLTPGGRLLCAYRVADAHVAKRSRLEVRSSDDRGRTWSPPQILAPRGHCPRFSVLDDGTVLLICDGINGTSLFRSQDEGRTWSAPTAHPFRHGIPDRPVRVGPTSLLTTGHRHIGKAVSPLIGQAPTEQVMYRSDDQGESWFEWSLLACDPNLVLCEASQFRMPDGSLRAFLRENSGCQEPIYHTASFDEGASWTPVRGTPMIGHRPCAGLLRSGKLLVTYRHVGLDGGNRAWLGPPDDMPEYAVSAFDPGQGATLTREHLVLQNDDGAANAVLYSLRPLTDPRLATASLEAEVSVRQSAGAHCGVYLGCQWVITPDRVQAKVPGAAPVLLNATAWHRYRFLYERGVVRLEVDGVPRQSVNLAAAGQKIDRSR